MNVKLKRDGLTLRGELLLPEKDSYDIFLCMDLPETATENY